ncbi:MAG: site-specific DNA-methyltransferase [Phycisphaerales bacterium]|nr:site-specific DNA-methyltransferase [Phycisphaerales bacterium]
MTKSRKRRSREQPRSVVNAGSAREPGVAGGGAWKLLHADWLVAAPELSRESIDFLYADPPFNTGKTKASPARAALKGRAADATYVDRWDTTADYIAWLRARVAATLPAMKRSGVVAIHCDFRACHHIRLLLDQLMGEVNFVNHLIWSYGLGGSSPRRFARKHDDILVYAIDARRCYFEPPMVPATSARLRGKLKKATDVLNIPSLNNMAAERTGYPTQKPLELLTLLVGAFSPPGGTVLDPCCGSGTTIEAAEAIGRSAIGFDLSARAVEIAIMRLISRGSCEARSGQRRHANPKGRPA